MFRIVSIALSFLFTFTYALAVEGGLELKVPIQEKKEVDPGVTINLLATLVNTTDVDKVVQVRFTSKDVNWKLIMDYSSIRIEKKSTIKKILGIQIPPNFKAGDYTITLEAVEKPSMVPFGSIDIPISVNSRYNFALSKLTTQEYIFSGDDILVSYLIENLSNLDIKVKTTSIRGSENKETELLIPKDSSIITKYKSSTLKLSEGYNQQSIIMLAKIVDKPETETSVYSTVDVFPSQMVKFDKYERYPIRISGIMAASNRLGKQIYSSMYDVQGMGTLGKDGKNTLDFHLRGPDRTGNPLFGMNDEYNLKFRSPNLFLTLGDYNFGLSELTESSRNGRGMELRYKFKKLTVGSYYAKPRYFPLVTQVVAAFANYDFSPKNGLSMGFLTKSDTLNKRQNLYTASAHNSPFSFLSTEVEVAFGMHQTRMAKAYKGTLHFNLSKFNSHLVYMYADPNFPGFVSNSLRFNSGSSLQLKKFTFAFSYDMNSTNMALDTLFSNMPFSKSMNLSFSYRLTPENTITLSGNQLSLQDQSPIPLFDYTKTSGRIAIQSKIKKLNLALIGDLGSMQNKLTPAAQNESFFINTTFNTYFLFSERFNGSAFITYQGGQKEVTGYDQFYYGGAITSIIRDFFSVSLQYNSNYEWRYYTSDRSLFSLNIFGKINKNNEINLTANYNLIRNTLNNKEYNVQLRYIYTLNIPVAKKKDMGSVKGKIINQGVEKVNDVLLNLNGHVAITDKEGAFRIPALPIGEYVMNINTSTIGINAMPVNPGPIKIMVEASKETYVECAMTSAGRITGRLRVEEDERANQKGFIGVKENIEKLIVEASNGLDVFRIYTDKEGGFRFDDLRPGKWQVKIYPKGLPLGYKLLTSIYSIDLTSGKQENIEVVIQKKARQIQFQSTTKK